MFWSGFILPCIKDLSGAGDLFDSIMNQYCLSLNLLERGDFTGMSVWADFLHIMNWMHLDLGQDR